MAWEIQREGYIPFISGLFGLVCRAKIANRIEHFFLFVADQAIIILSPLLHKKTTGKRHSYRMSRFVKDEHGKCGNQVIEQAVLWIPEIRIALT